jgi:hypothetical protein
MDNLSSKVRSRGTYETDQFNERYANFNTYFSRICFAFRRWNKASNELQSHVVTSRSRKAAAARNAPAPSSTSGTTIFGALGDRVSRLFTGGSKEETDEHQAVVPASAPRSHAKRSYGFATSNLSHFTDRNSEDLYRYKNISSDYMRETSPVRNNDDDDDRPAAAAAWGGSRAATRRPVNADRAPEKLGARRSAGRKPKNDDNNDKNSDSEEKK